MSLEILYTESSLGWGGQELRTLNEARGLIARGHRALLACPQQATIHREAARFGVPVIALPIGDKRPSGVLAMRRLLKRQRFSVVNTHSSTDSWLVALACASLAGAPPIVRTRHLSTAIGRGPGTHWLYERAARCIVTTGEALRTALIEEAGLRRVPIVSVPTGIDVSRYAPGDAAHARAALGLAPEGFVVGIVATLRSWKGHLHLLEAFARVRQPGDRLLVVGDGPQQHNLEAAIGRLGLRDAVTMTGRRDDPERWMRCFDVFCLPSYANEGVSQALMQAMACALPAITCHVGSMAEVAIDERTALVVPPRDVDALARAIVRLRDDRALRRRLGDAARDHILAGYTFERMCERMEAIYRAVSAGEPVPVFESASGAHAMPASPSSRAVS